MRAHTMAEAFWMRCLVALVVTVQGGAITAEASTGLALSLSLPRCKNNFEAIPMLERPATEFSNEKSWQPYRLTSKNRDCAYQLMTPSRLNACMANRWLVHVGGSHQAIDSHTMLQMFLGPERTKKRFNYKTDEEWKEMYWQPHFGASFDFSSIQRPLECWGDQCHKDVHVDGRGYISSLHARFLHEVIPFLEKVKLEQAAFSGSHPMPIPDIFIKSDYWISQCYNKLDVKWHWSTIPCTNAIYKDLPVISKEAIIEHQVKEYHKILAYLRDEWPQVHFIRQEKLEFMHHLEPYFSPEVLLDNRYPDVQWVTDSLHFDKNVEGSLRQGSHFVGRIPILKNHRLLDSLCKEGRTNNVDVSNSVIYFAPTCKAYDDRNFWHVAPCYHRLAKSHLQVPRQVRHSEIQLEVPSKPKTHGGHIGYEEHYTLYHKLIMLFSSLVLISASVTHFHTSTWKAFCIQYPKTLCSKSLCALKSTITVGSNGRTLNGLNKLDTSVTPLLLPQHHKIEPNEFPHSPSKTKAPPMRERGGKLRALGMARYIASCHVVIGHLTNGFPLSDGFRVYPVPAWQVNGWGFSWVPFFMMLSGFVLTYARVNSSNPAKCEPWTTFTYKRLKSVYPLYLCGLLASAGQKAALTGQTLTLGSPVEAASLLLLLQAWLPTVAVQGVQAHCWFLSCIVPYWSVHQQVYRVLLSLRTRYLWVIAFLVTLAPMVGLWLVPYALDMPVDWYKDWNGWTLETTQDYAVAMLKFHPLCYFHIYVFGIVAALLMKRMEEHSDTVRFLFQNGACIGFSGLFATFYFSNTISIPAYKLSCRLGVLAPLQGLYLIGLALQIDPLARFFSLDIFQHLEHVSFPQYIFQFIAFNAWQTYVGTGFWVWLSALSTLGYLLVQQPMKSQTAKALDIIRGTTQLTWLAGMIALLAFAYREDILYQKEVLLLPRVNLGHGAWDSRLSPTIAPAIEASTGTDKYAHLINPSLLWDEERNQMFVALRAHRYLQHEMENRQVFKWNSDVFMGRVNPETFEPLEPFVAPFSKSDTHWRHCSNPAFVENFSNNSQTRTVVTGAEDPRLVMKGPNLILTSNFYQPMSSIAEPGKCNTGGRMVMKAFQLDSDRSSRVRLLRSPTALRAATEKNWLAFNHDGTLRFVQSIYPFVVLHRGDQSEWDQRSHVTVESSKVHPELERLHIELGLEFHGGANPVEMNYVASNNTLSWPSSSTIPRVFVGIFHTVSRSGAYVNYFFQFSRNADEKGWIIDRISRPLELFGVKPKPSSGVFRRMAFASGLTISPQGVYIGYGSSNAEARVRYLPWHVFNSYF